MGNSLESLTKKQTAILNFIYDFFQDKQYYPSYKEIAKEFKFNSDGTVRTYLEILERKKYIKRHSKARALTLLAQPFSTPILGHIHAGTPTEAIENFDKTVESLTMLKHKKNKFALTIKGDSMINAGILEGDIAIIEKDLPIRSGDIVAALIDNEATLKRYIKEKDHITLKAENNDFKSIFIYKSSNLKILGKCTGTIRSY
tara:strand:+ start:8813 stop:9415 length:603 start_codon:yes stop_codon:yes gene_type:complete